ncbi:single-stranded DNA-binding protein [cyanobiont of Ornithocercus magnificus]|nr:single-stranded DNA-binding protein [cyanobiont of Ornithocercus magnificus]
MNFYGKDVVTPEPLTLVGYQHILTSKFDYDCTASCPEDIIRELEVERVHLLDLAYANIKDKERATKKPAPWRKRSDDYHPEADQPFILKFYWQERNAPTVVDSMGAPVAASEKLPIYAGSRVKLAFRQKTYTMKDGFTYGTKLEIRGIQLIYLGEALSSSETAELFGTFEGGYVQASGNFDSGGDAESDLPF